MKSTQNQYIDLIEGRMSQQNFMRNLRMTMPQYITNVTSFGDAVKILTNKSILSESHSFSEKDYDTLLNTILKHVKDPKEAEMYASNPTSMPSWLKDKVQGLNENGDYNAIIPALKAKGITSSMPEKEIINAIAKVMKELGYTNNQILNLVNRDEDFLPDLLQDLKNNKKQDMPGFEGTLDALNNLEEEKMSKAEEIAMLKDEIKHLMDTGSQQDPEIVSDKIDDIRAKIEKLKAEKSESLNEAVNDSGKQEYSKFSENANDNFNELIDGIHIEHECYPAKTYDEIVSIVTKNLKKDPFYYTMYKLTGTPGNKPQTMDASKPEIHQMKYYTGENAVDAVRGMKPVKDVEKFKADKAKATKAKAKNVKVDVFSLVAKSQRGIPKMKPLGEKMKKVVMKEATMPFKDLPADPEKYKTVKDSKGKIIKATNADGNEFQRGDITTAVDNGEKVKIADFKEEQGKIKALYSKGMFFSTIDIDGLNPVKETMRPGVDMGSSFEKIKKSLEEMVREVIDEMYDGRDNLDAEI